MLMRQAARVLMASSRAPMIGISFVRHANSRDQWLVSQPLSGGNSPLLGRVSRVDHGLVVLIFQLITADWPVMAFGLRLDIYIWHNWPSVNLIVIEGKNPSESHIYPRSEKTQYACGNRSFLSRSANRSRVDASRKLAGRACDQAAVDPSLRPLAALAAPTAETVFAS